MKRLFHFFLILSVCLILSSCSNKGLETAQEKPVELMISAAASLSDVLMDVKDTYEQMNENVVLTFNFGSSGKLANQIDQGAPVDVFLSASSKDMDTLAEKGMIDKTTRVDFTKNVLVLISSLNSNFELNSFEQIDSAQIDHFAIGEPESVPVGRYAKQVFEHLDLWQPLQDKLVMGSDVRQVLTYVEMGNADLGVVYSSDAFISDRVKVLAEANPEWHKPILYPGAIIEDSRHKNEAQAFLDYLMSEEGKDTLQKFGFK